VDDLLNCLINMGRPPGVATAGERRRGDSVEATVDDDDDDDDAGFTKGAMIVGTEAGTGTGVGVAGRGEEDI
jgi:hypothetical protein